MKVLRYLFALFVLILSAQPTMAQFKAYDKVFDFDKNGFARVCNNYEKENLLMGVIDKTGREIIPLKYHDVQLCDNLLAIVTEAGEEGDKGMKALADLKSGREITKFKFNEVWPFEKGLAFAVTEKGNEVIDAKGATVRRLNIEEAEYMGSGFILRPTDDYSGVMFYNLNGKRISNKIFPDGYHFEGEDVNPFGGAEDGWIQVWLDDATDFDNKNSHWLSYEGKIISNAEYLAQKNNEEYYLIYDEEMEELCLHSTKKSEVILKLKGNYCEICSEIERIALKKNGKELLLDYSGKELATFDIIYRFVSEDLFRVREGQNEWFVDKNGTKVIDYTGKYADYGSMTQPFFSEGLAPYKAKRLKGFIDKTGEVVIPAQYEKLYPFRDGHAIVQDPTTKKYGMIDKTGKQILPCTYKYCNYSSQAGYAIVRTDDGKQMFVKLSQ